MDIHEKARQQCIVTTKALINNKNGAPFSQPVDYVALGIPHYPTIIKRPMDLGSIQVRANPARRCCGALTLGRGDRKSWVLTSTAAWTSGSLTCD